MKHYTTLTIRTKNNHAIDWQFRTQNVRDNGGLDNHVKDIERLYNVQVIGITQYVERAC